MWSQPGNVRRHSFCSFLLSSRIGVWSSLLASFSIVLHVLSSLSTAIIPPKRLRFFLAPMCSWGSDSDCKYAIVRKCRPRCRCGSCRGCGCGSSLCGGRSRSCSRSPSPCCCKTCRDKEKKDKEEKEKKEKEEKEKKEKEEKEKKEKEKKAEAAPAPQVMVPTGWAYVEPFDVDASRDRHVITLTHYDQPGAQGGPTLKMRGQHFTGGKEDWSDQQSVHTLADISLMIVHTHADSFCSGPGRTPKRDGRLPAASWVFRVSTRPRFVSLSHTQPVQNRFLNVGEFESEKEEKLTRIPTLGPASAGVRSASGTRSATCVPLGRSARKFHV